MEDYKKKFEEMKKVKDQPLSRSEIEHSYDLELKNKYRFGDPMKGIVSSTINDGNYINVSRGFYLPNCKFAAPVNRFGIGPGYRWDGVDRSTGFERRYLEESNLRKAKEEEYYKIRTEDM